ncbi:MAG: winged helix-turn-helix transcriptional regulator [Alphaproteobacteria bacterium]|nr:winged helix-turn-helix transcriptional regulator [Alphaproteobacteria bacterium]
MVKHSLDTTFNALADPTRRAILARLALGETATSELAEPFDISLPAVLKHLAVLEDAGLVKRQKRGRTAWCALSPGPLKSASDWMAQYQPFWDERLDALAAYLSRNKN